MIRIIRLLLALAMLAAMNLHLPALQVVAWTGMLISYSQGRSVSEAVSMTFDGNNPCPMCKVIKKQQMERTEQLDSVSPSPRLIAVAYTPAPWYPHILALESTYCAPRAWPAFSSEPERLPPRVVA